MILIFHGCKRTACQHPAQSTNLLHRWHENKRGGHMGRNSSKRGGQIGRNPGDSLISRTPDSPTGRLLRVLCTRQQWMQSAPTCIVLVPQPLTTIATTTPCAQSGTQVLSAAPHASPRVRRLPPWRHLTGKCCPPWRASWWSGGLLRWPSIGRGLGVVLPVQAIAFANKCDETKHKTLSIAYHLTKHKT